LNLCVFVISDIFELDINTIQEWKLFLLFKGLVVDCRDELEGGEKHVTFVGAILKGGVHVELVLNKRHLDLLLLDKAAQVLTSMYPYGRASLLEPINEGDRVLWTCLFNS